MAHGTTPSELPVDRPRQPRGTSAKERREWILASVARNGFVRTSEVVYQFGVSRMTVHRDLKSLSQQGLIDRRRGGAIAVAPSPQGVVGDDRPDGHPPHGEQDLYVGWLTPSVEYHYRTLIRSAQATFQAAGVHLSVITTSSDGHSDQHEREHLKRLLDTGIRGVLLTPALWTDGDSDGPRREWIESLPVPTVLVEREPLRMEMTNAWSVMTDHQRGVAMAVAHLQELGHHRISLMTLSDRMLGGQVQRGWENSLAASGLDLDVPLIDGTGIKDWPMCEPKELDRVLEGLQQHSVTAVICASDVLAMPFTQHAQLRGWAIPGDLSIVAYGDEVAALGALPLTAVSTPRLEIGRLAAQALLDLISHRPRSARRIRVVPDLVTRQSTGPPVSA